MTDFKTVTPDFAVSPQIGLDDLQAAKAAGVTLVINNRPDDEAPGQPSSREVQAAAEALGLDYLFVPFVGRPTREQAEAISAAIDEADGPVLAFCRSGTRSINAWALGQALSGKRPREELLELGYKAGYDLSAILA